MEAERTLRRIDKLLEAGRVTSEEAARVRAASDTGELDDAVREIRLRHARERLGAQSRDGGVTQEEAELILQRIEKGEHRGLLRGHRRRKSSGLPAAPLASAAENADAIGDEHGRDTRG
ncbi:MAG: hypothetical protein M3450_19485 [Actinomycetota bacterium]|nr:hypothetical protein [Actinomycetota bacterium]